MQRWDSPSRANYVGEFEPQEILSIGDQYHSDIAPARKMGMQTLQVFKVKDLEKVLDLVNSNVSLSN
jgi:FMN phosphatase YigB (HAD superfamily)